MAEDLRDLFYHQPFHESSPNNFYSNSNITSNTYASVMATENSSLLHSSHMLDPSFMSLGEFLLQGSSDHHHHPDAIARAFGLSSSVDIQQPAAPKSSFPLVVKDHDQGATCGGEIPVTPNSSISSSSTEAANGDHEDTNNKGKKDKQQLMDTHEDDHESPKKDQ